MSHGGKRSGAGRKSSYGGDKTVALRVPEPLKPVLEDWLRDYRSWRTANSAHADDVRTLARQLSELSLPLFANSVPAGSPVAADDLKEDDVDLNTRLAPRPGSTFLVTVKGESMLGAGIHDGDLLVVDRAAEARNGKVVVAALNGELTVKRLEKPPRACACCRKTRNSSRFRCRKTPPSISGASSPTSSTKWTEPSGEQHGTHSSAVRQHQDEVHGLAPAARLPRGDPGPAASAGQPPGRDFYVPVQFV